MWLGRHKLGDVITLACQCVNGSGTPTVPDDAPYARIYNGAGTLIKTARMPIADSFKVTGYFSRPLHLGAEFSVGRIAVFYSWTISSTGYGDRDEFEIVAGGNPDGQVIAMHSFDRPDSNFVIYEAASGRLLKGRNPTL